MTPIFASIKKCIQSFSYASSGLWYALKNENNFNYHTLATIVVVTLGLIVNLNIIEWMVIIILIGIVFLAEVFNTAIEKLVDLLHPDFQARAGLVKDISAGGVLVASIISAVAGILLFIEKIF
jgi:diacylglycerol kinase (ATP)